ncbi:MAG: hypothetical protein AB1646_01250 [Thermodesulfobacteriota bacterium]
MLVCCVVAACGYKTSPRPMGTTVPGPIGLVDCSVYPDRILLKWEVPGSNADGSALRDLSGFRVYRASHKTGSECADCKKTREIYANVDIEDPTNAAVVGNEVVYADKKVITGNTYIYRVTAYNLKGREGLPTTELEVDFREAPEPPASLEGTWREGEVVLRWTPPKEREGVTTYRIYRAGVNKSEAMKPIGLADWGETQYSDKRIEKDQTYFYQMRSVRIARGIAQESQPSHTVMVKIPRKRVPTPKKPESIPERDAIRIDWEAVKVDEGVVKYNIYRQEPGRTPAKLNAKPLDGTSFKDRNVKDGREYLYSVTAFVEGREDEESARSETTKELKYRRPAPVPR